MKPKKKCCFYIRVSTTMQVDGYSLDAQRETSLFAADAGLWCQSDLRGGRYRQFQGFRQADSVLSAVAEIGRENIFVQTIKGRCQKEREGTGREGIVLR